MMSFWFATTIPYNQELCDPYCSFLFPSRILLRESLADVTITDARITFTETFTDYFFYAPRILIECWDTLLWNPLGFTCQAWSTWESSTRRVNSLYLDITEFTDNRWAQKTFNVIWRCCGWWVFDSRQPYLLQELCDPYCSFLFLQSHSPSGVVSRRLINFNLIKS